MAGDVPPKIGTQHGIDVKGIEIERQMRWPIAPQVYCAIDRKPRIIEIRTARQLHIGAVSNGVKGEIAGTFIIETQITQANFAVYHRGFASPITVCRKVQLPGNLDLAGLQGRDMNQVEVRSLQVKTEDARLEVVGSTAGNLTTAIDSGCIIELNFVVCEMQVGSQSRQRLPVKAAVSKLHMAIAVGLGSGTGGGQG